MKVEIKNYDSSFLYGKANYGKTLYEYIIKAERIDKDSEAFEDIKYIVKRNQITSCLSSLLDRASIILTMPTKPMPRAFKVVAMKDVKEDKQTKVFIDCSEVLKYQNGVYSIRNSDINKLISYLACALNTLIYHASPSHILNNNTLITTSTTSFAKLCTNVIDYMRIGGVDDVRTKMLYISSLYYQIGILLRDDTDSVEQRARKISNISIRDAQIIRAQAPESSFENIDTFVNCIGKILKVENTLKLDNFMDKWLLLYGSGTQFATEIYTAFANLLINAYVGAYLNNQKQIETATGRNMVQFCNTLFKLGGEVL